MTMKGNPVGVPFWSALYVFVSLWPHLFVVDNKNCKLCGSLVELELHPCSGTDSPLFAIKSLSNSFSGHARNYLVLPSSVGNRVAQYLCVYILMWVVHSIDEIAPAPLVNRHVLHYLT